MKPADKTWIIESKKNFVKYWFNKFPALVILAGTSVVVGGFAWYSIGRYQDTVPFYYRFKYTIWREDDPRAIKMMERMENFKPLRRID